MRPIERRIIINAINAISWLGQYGPFEGFEFTDEIDAKIAKTVSSDDEIQRVKRIFPAILECDDRFGDDCNGNRKRVAERWTLVRNVFLAAGTDACMELVADIDNARSVFKNNKGHKANRGRTLEENLESHDECQEKLPLLLRDDKNPDNKYWIRMDQNAAKNPPAGISGSGFSIIKTLVWWGLHSMFVREQAE